MKKEEYKIINKFIDRLLGDLKIELKGEHLESIDFEAIKGAIRYMQGYLKCWKEIIKDETLN